MTQPRTDAETWTCRFCGADNPDAFPTSCSACCYPRSYTTETPR